MKRQTPVGQGLLIAKASRSQTHCTRYYSSGLVISPKQGHLRYNTQRLQEVDIPAPDGIRTRNRRK